MDASNRVPYVFGDFSPIHARDLTPKEWGEIIWYAIKHEEMLEYLSGFRPLMALANNDIREIRTGRIIRYPRVCENLIPEGMRSLHLLPLCSRENEETVETRLGNKQRVITRELLLSRKRDLVVWDAVWKKNDKNDHYGTAISSDVHIRESYDYASMFEKDLRLGVDILTSLSDAIGETIRQRFRRLEDFREAERALVSLANRAGIALTPLTLELHR